MSIPISERELLKWKNAEFLSHKLPAVLQKACVNASNYSFIMQDEDGEERSYKAELVKGLHPGLVCFIITPLDLSNNRVHIVFRGTHNRASSQRNLKPNAPGEDSYNRYRFTILQAIVNRIRKVKVNSGQKVAVTFGGHSLGGGDASRSATDVLNAIAANPNGEFANSIESINIIHKNSVGVSATTSKTCKAAVTNIRKTIPKEQLGINYYPISVIGDSVPKTGYTAILSDMPPEHGNIKMLKVDIGVEEKFSFRALIFDGPIAAIKRSLNNIYNAHKFKIFNEDTLHTITFEAKNVKFDFQSNHNAEGRAKIYRELNYKVLQNAYEAVRLAINKPLYAFIYSKSQDYRSSNSKNSIDTPDKFSR